MSRVTWVAAAPSPGASMAARPVARPGSLRHALNGSQPIRRLNEGPRVSPGATNRATVQKTLVERRGIEPLTS